MAPSYLVTQPQGVEGPHGEVLPVGTEGEAGDGIVVETGAVELSAEHVPDPVATLLSPRHYPASAGAPVSAEDQPLPAPPVEGSLHAITQGVHSSNNYKKQPNSSNKQLQRFPHPE